MAAPGATAGTAVTAILIAGPTASGKSAVAVRLAEERGGVVINADSMQVYRELSILTARPGPDDLARVPHVLYGHVAASVAYSAGRYAIDVAAAIADARAAQRLPVIVGGTGLYFKVLLEGLSPIPPIPEDVRRHWRAEAERSGAAALHATLAVRDVAMATRLSATDTQRVVRALEVLDATGRSLNDWQRESGVAIIDAQTAERLVLAPPREVVTARADRRVDQMIEAGAIGEVEQLLRLGLDPALPAMRALGVAPIARHLAGHGTRAEAIAATKLETRQYIKRQETWIKKHMITWNRIF